MLTVDIDRLKVIRSGSVMKMQSCRCKSLSKIAIWQPFEDQIKILYRYGLYLDTYSHKVETF
jgi:hypothetical protein